MKQRLVITASNRGDISVGINPLIAIITIEANVDMDEVLSDIKYKDNEKTFLGDIKNLLLWVDDQPSEVQEYIAKE